MDALADDFKNKATIANGSPENTTKEAGTGAAAAVAMTVDKKSKTKATAQGKHLTRRLRTTRAPSEESN